MTAAVPVSVSLSGFQEELVLSGLSRGYRVTGAEWVRRYLRPCPVRVHVANRAGRGQDVILKIDRFAGGVDLEARLLPALSATGLPVAEVLAGPAADPEQPALGSMTVLTALPGENLLRLLKAGAPADRGGLLALLLEGVHRLHSTTDPVEPHSRTLGLPRRTLESELRQIVQSAGSNRATAEFDSAVELLRPLAAAAGTALVFSNGDLNPANFLSDGKALTGFLDFGGACWEDPLLGVAMLTRLHWAAFDAEHVAARWCQRIGFTKPDLELRIAIACLARLTEPSLTTSPSNAEQQQFALNRLQAALRSLN